MPSIPREISEQIINLNVNNRSFVPSLINEVVARQKTITKLQKISQLPVHKKRKVQPLFRLQDLLQITKPKKEPVARSKDVSNVIGQFKA